MATLTPGPTTAGKICRYWLNHGGCCNPCCPFLHPPHGMVPAYAIPKSSIPCYFFQRGKCGRGANCAFMHAPPLASPKLSQLNSPLISTSDADVNTEPSQEQNDSPSSDNSTGSEDSLDIIVGDDPSYDLQEADWYGSFHNLPCQIPTWYGTRECYSSSGRKRPLEQEAESTIRHVDEQPETKQRRLDVTSLVKACPETHDCTEKGRVE